MPRKKNGRRSRRNQSNYAIESDEETEAPTPARFVTISVPGSDANERFLTLLAKIEQGQEDMPRGQDELREQVKVVQLLNEIKAGYVGREPGFA